MFSFGEVLLNDLRFETKPGPLSILLLYLFGKQEFNGSLNHTLRNNSIFTDCYDPSFRPSSLTPVTQEPYRVSSPTLRMELRLD